MVCRECLRVSPDALNSDDFTCQTRNFYLWLLQVLVLLGLLALCLWLIFRPKSPEYTIVDFFVPVTNSSLTDNGGNFSYYLQIQNPNKDSTIFFDDILLTFFNGQESVATDTIRSYRHGKDKTVVFSGHSDLRPPNWKSLQNAMLNATAELKVSLQARFQYKTWSLKSKHHRADVEGKLRIGKDGKISNKKKKVKLTHKSKKWSLRASRYL